MRHFRIILLEYMLEYEMHYFIIKKLIIFQVFQYNIRLFRYY